MSTIYVYNAARRTLHAQVDGKSFEQCNLDEIRERSALSLGEAQEKVEAGASLCLRCFPNGDLTEIGVMTAIPAAQPGAAPTVDNLHHPTGATPHLDNPPDAADRLQHVNPDMPTERFESVRDDPSHPAPPQAEPGTTTVADLER